MPKSRLTKQYAVIWKDGIIKFKGEIPQNPDSVTPEAITVLYTNDSCFESDSLIDVENKIKELGLQEQED